MRKILMVLALPFALTLAACEVEDTGGTADPAGGVPAAPAGEVAPITPAQ